MNTPVPPSPIHHSDSAQSERLGSIQIRAVTKQFATAGSCLTALENFSLLVQPGQFVSLVGPSGCGKSTLLALVAGLVPTTQGTIEVNGQQVDGIPPGVGFLFQHDALLPWKTVFENVILAPTLRHWPQRQAQAAAHEWIERVMLERFAQHYPYQLSGGMRKRVALAQTLIYDPAIILMDEPFSELDAQTRQLLENELMSLCAESRRTVLFVTHDLAEAVALGDQVVTLTARPGKVKAVYPIQLPRPRDLNEIQFDPHFTAIHAQIWQDLREEVNLSHAGSSPDDLAENHTCAPLY